MKDFPDFSIEKRLGSTVCGIDEVGRAPLAGPVVCACVLIPQEMTENDIWTEVNDSKKLSKKKREFLYEEITEKALYAFGQVSVEEIDRINIYHASLLSMSEAYKAFCKKYKIIPDYILVDGNAKPKIEGKENTIIPVVKGDTKSVSIACASIIAKVHRDKMMSDYHEKYPFYGWNRNAGYPTKEHISSLDLHGITVHHRKSFAPVRERISNCTG